MEIDFWQPQAIRPENGSSKSFKDPESARFASKMLEGLHWRGRREGSRRFCGNSCLCQAAIAFLPKRLIKTSKILKMHVCASKAFTGLPWRERREESDGFRWN